MKAYATDPWHIIDLLIVILAGVDFLGWIPFEGVGKTSPPAPVAKGREGICSGWQNSKKGYFSNTRRAGSTKSFADEGII